MSTRTLLTALFATALTLPILAQAADTPPANQQPPGTVPSAAPVAPATPAPPPAIATTVAPTPAPTPAPAPAVTVPADTAAPAAVAPAAAAPADQASAVTVGGAAPAPAVTRDKDTLSVDFPDEDIKTILRNVADLFELNLVVPDTLTGKTSIKLRDVSWRQIFHVVLSPVGYTYIEEGNIIKIVSNELLQQEPGATEVFILNNAKAADIKPTIDGLVDAATGGKIVIDARSNSLVITERPSRMSRIRSIIDQLDKATDQVMIESKFVEVTDRDIRNIGVNWASLQGMTFGVGGIKQTFSRDRGQTTADGSQTTTNGSNGTTGSTSNGTTTNTTNGTTNTTTTGATGGTTTTNTGGITTSSTQSNTGSQLATNIITGLPTTVPVASNGVTTTSSSPTSQTNTTNGTTTGSTGGTSGSTSTSITDAIANGVTNTLTTALQSLTGVSNTGGTSRLATAVFSASDFNVILSALKTQDNTKIVSNPTVVTLNNTEAMLNIGQEFPVPSYTYNSERGSFEVSGFTYKPIGIILKVTPQVNARGIIRLALEPEVSQQNGSTSFGGAGGASIPIIATRKVKTQVSLKDGYTMGLGGLITSSQDHGGTQVPVLGSIPILGRLFSSKNVNDTATNLLIFITAKTVNADGASPEEVFDPRSIQAAGMTRDDLPGNRAAKGTDLYAVPAKKP
jgi:type II secretory pathway component GspD/PulD (secretin)